MCGLSKLQNIRKNISLEPYTTFKIGGKAKYFYIAKNNDDLVKVIKCAKKANLPYFILGGGSNVLVSDKGFNGLVIKLSFANAGVLLSKLVDESIKAGLTGLEWAVGIPGTIGGAVKVNASAFGSSMSDIVKSVKRYKDILLFVELELKRGDRKKSEKLIQKYLEYRKKSQPLEFPSAGCIFKNPKGDFAGRLIDQCGLKGTKEGRAMISEKHGNFIVNTGNAKASDVKKLIDLCKKKVKEKFGIELEEEIEYLGEF